MELILKSQKRGRLEVLSIIHQTELMTQTDEAVVKDVSYILPIFSR